MAGNVCVRVAHKRYEDRGRSAVIGHGKDTHSQDLTEEQAFSQAVAADSRATLPVFGEDGLTRGGLSTCADPMLTPR